MPLTQKIPQFFQEVRAEVKKVNWPTRQETLKYTLAVFAVSILTALFLGLIDLLFSRFLEKIISFRLK